MKKLYFLLCVIFCIALVACSKKPSEDVAVADATNSNEHVDVAERLGTKWGDEVNSPVKTISAERMSNEPIAELQLRYAAKAFTGKSVNSISIVAGKISFSVIDDQGQTLPLYRDHQQYYLKAKDGQSYQLKYVNHTDRAYEVIASVDGLDVLNGSMASKYHAGYLLYPHRILVIEGFRKSDRAVASFTFGTPEDSYAANSSQGSENNTGIIGVSIFEVSLPEEEVTAIDTEEDSRFAPTPQAFPADKKN